MLREDHGADGIAAFIEEAAEVYEERGLFVRSASDDGHSRPPLQC